MINRKDKDEDNGSSVVENGPSSAALLLEFAYFIESQSSSDLGNLLQRLSILVAADAALAGLWANTLVQIVPHLEPLPCSKVLVTGLIVPLFLLGGSLLLAGIALAFRIHLSIDPNKILTDSYLAADPDEVMKEIAASYRRDWDEAYDIRERRTKLFNAALIVLFVGLGWVLIVLPTALPFVEK